MIGVPATIAGTFWPMQQTQNGVTHDLDFPVAIAQGLWTRGQLYLQTWGAYDLTAKKSWVVADVLAGKYNQYLHRQAGLLKALGHPVFVRLDHEMTWAGSAFFMSGADFIALWQYIVTLFKQDGATNVTWVWCPNSINPGVDVSDHYPGDQYVDWKAVDCYNWAGSRTPAARWLTFSQMFTASYDALLAIGDPNKPIMLAEWASDDRGGDKAAWLRDALTVLPQQYPLVQAFLYYPCVTANEHWPLSASDGTIAAYLAGLASGPYASVGFQMPPDGQPIVPLQSVSAWGDPLAPLAQQLSVTTVQLRGAQAALAQSVNDTSVAQSAADALTDTLNSTTADLAAARQQAAELSTQVDAYQAAAHQVTAGLDSLRSLTVTP